MKLESKPKFFFLHHFSLLPFRGSSHKPWEKLKRSVIISPDATTLSKGSLKFFNKFSYRVSFLQFYCHQPFQNCKLCVSIIMHRSCFQFVPNLNPYQTIKTFIQLPHVVNSEFLCFQTLDIPFFFKEWLTQCEAALLPWQLGTKDKREEEEWS